MPPDGVYRPYMYLSPLPSPQKKTCPLYCIPLDNTQTWLGIAHVCVNICPSSFRSSHAVSVYQTVDGETLTGLVLKGNHRTKRKES
jgi:hypothetical protein